MYDIKHLESEWKKYRKKKLRVWYIFFLFLFLLSVMAITLFNDTEVDVSAVNGYFKSSKETLGLQENTKDAQVSEENKMKSTLLVESPLKTLELENSVNETAETSSNSSSGLLVDIPLLEESNEPVENGIPRSRKKVHLEIIESTSATAYKDVENRFHQSHDIDDALFLAKSYYKNGNYKKAEYWALQANRLDETMEESLLIFVKSKVKLGNKNEALSILTSYIKKANSEEGRKLLYEIENGKL